MQEVNQDQPAGGGQGCFGLRIGCLRRFQDIPECPEELRRQQASQVTLTSFYLVALGNTC